MQKVKAFKIGMLGLLIVIGSLASVMYALAYTEKREVVYSNTIKIEGGEVMFRAFYLSAPAGLFEVKLSVSEGTIKWTPHSAVDVRRYAWMVSMSNRWGFIRDDSEMGVRNRQRNRQMGCGTGKREHGLVPQLLQSRLI